MTWTIGSVTLPSGPWYANTTSSQRTQSVTVYTEAPWIYPFGSDGRRLTIRGALSNSPLTRGSLEISYLLPLRRMVEKSSEFPYMLVDDEQTDFWTLTTLAEGTELLTAAITDDTTTYQKGTVSLQMTMGAGTVCNRWYISHTFSSTRDWSNKDFICFWWYGNNSGCTFEFWCGADWNEAYKIEWTDNWSGWQRQIYRLDQLSVRLGTPSWSDIVKCAFEQKTSNQEGTWYLDRTVAGVGVYIDAPDTRYDGLYIPKKLETPEGVGTTPESLNYTMEFLWCDDYY